MILFSILGISQFNGIQKLGARKGLNFSYDQDIIYAFFMNCYHLKDWIINDPTVNLPSTKVEKFINSNPCMCICADICNGLKHLTLNRSRSKENPRFTSRKYVLTIGETEQTIQIKYFIGTKDAFELASECVQKWKQFIDKFI
jgi:hypothetical protein